MKPSDERLAGLVAAAGGLLPFAARRDHLVLAHQFHAVADQFHRQLVVAHADALVVGHEVPALQGVAADVARLGPIHVADQPHRRPFQADADQLHAVVGLDHHLGEVASSAKRR